MLEGSFIGYPSIPSLFNAVSRGEIGIGVAPIENSVEGSVGATNDQLYRDDLRISGELYTKITHCLIAPYGTDIGKIRKVISHPQALGQCSCYIEKMGFDPVGFQDTASAVASLSDPSYSGYAAIGNRMSARLYGMDILQDDIGDFSDNYTRFISVTRSNLKPDVGARMKASVVLSLEDSPGSLKKALEIYSSHGVNLTRIESRPVKFSPWKYIFFLDSEYSQGSDILFRELERNSLSFKLLGVYPMAGF